MKGRRTIAIVLGAALIAVIIWFITSRGKEADEEKEQAKSQSNITRTAEGEPLLKISPKMQAQAGIRTLVLTTHRLQPEILAYGRLEEDPGLSFTLRAPVAGILHAGKDGRWPTIGETLFPEAIIGTIEPRFAPAERISLLNQLTTARAELNASTSAAATARAAYERARILNADNKNVSDRVLQEAESRMKEQEERAKAAKENVQLLDESLRAFGPAGSKPLVAERGGDVVELMAHPGEAIEPGSPILRLTRLDRLLARIEIPPSERVPPNVSSARIVATGLEDQPIPATRVAVAPNADPQTQGQPFYFRLATVHFGLRPGHAVTAYVYLPGTPRQGVIIPRAAVVRVSGMTYAYVQTAPDQFVRKQVPLDYPVEGGYFSSANFSPGEKVVVVGAQTLVSEEFKSQIAVEENE